jgi:hypothetical protein
MEYKKNCNNYILNFKINEFKKIMKGSLRVLN